MTILSALIRQKNYLCKKYNMYYPVDTDKWDSVTDIELDNMVSGLNITLIA